MIDDHGRSLELLTSPVPRVLEEELVRRVRAAVDCDRGARVAIVVPTLLLADRVRRVLARAAGEEGVVAGVEVMHHRHLATRVLELAFVLGARREPPPRLLGSMERDALVKAALGGLPPSSRLKWLGRERPRSRDALGRTLSELREALVTPDALGRVLGSRHDLALVHAAHVRLLDGVERDLAATDQAGHALAAAEGARALAGKLPWTLAIHHGSYELVGSQVELVRALAEGVATIVLAPSGDGSAHAAARRALARWPGVTEERLAGEGLLDVEALFDESRAPRRRPDAGGRPAVEAVHVRGARTELETAARLAAEAYLEGGVPLEEIAVVARSLEPLAGHVEAAFGAHGVPFTTNAKAPLLRDPWAQAARTLLVVLAEGLPRAPLVELVRSPWMRIEGKVASVQDVVPDLWDEWSLEAHVTRGAASLRADLRAWHDADVRSRARRDDEDEARAADAPWALLRLRRLEALASVASRLDDAAAEWRKCATASEHAAFLRSTIASWLRAPDPRAEAAARASSSSVARTLDELERLDALPAAARETLDPARVLRLLDTALGAGTLPMGEADGSGVRVLSASQARALPVKELFLVGMEQGSFPRRSRRDPFLGDSARERLRVEAPALSLPSEGRDEERLLLALLLAAPEARVTVMRQRADDDGRARAPSPYLREVARLATGHARLESATRGARGLPVLALPGHPAEAARVLRERTGRATFGDACLEASLRVQRRRAIEALADDTHRLDESLRAGLDATRVLDAFELPTDGEARALALRHDGILGPGLVARPEALSATSLETLGSCSLRWLFERALGVRALVDEPEEGGVVASDLGNIVHATLEDVVGQAIARGGEPTWLASPEAADLLRAAWSRHLDAAAGARRDRAPVAWDALSQRWIEALLRFLAADSARLASKRARLVAVEEHLAHEIIIRSGASSVSLRLHGRVDRIVETPDGWQVEDYKTQADVSRHVAPADVLKGFRLQGLAYLLLAREWAKGRPHARLPAGAAPFVSVAFLPVHPDAPSFEPSELEVADRFPDSWPETLVVLDQVLAKGAFALKPTTCEWCAVQLACRRHHAPSQERRTKTDAIADYLALSAKSTLKPSIADVRRAASAAEGDA